MAMTPAERALRARTAAHVSWANTTDPLTRTAPGRAAAARSLQDRFERQADPDGSLDPAERARRAKHLRAAYMADLARRSVKARRLKSEGGADRAT